jgi:hypothetical protein
MRRAPCPVLTVKAHAAESAVPATAPPAGIAPVT